MTTPAFAPALPHGELVEVLPDVFFVTGTIQMAPLIRFSRNMTVVREGERLVLIGTVRLDDAGLAALDRLGKVTDVIRLAGFHGMDDPFYKDRYGAKVWVLEGMSYVRGFKPDPAVPPYFAADVEIGPSTDLPLRDASLYSFSTKPPEALLLIEREGGIVVSGDCLQNWGRTNRYFSLPGKLMMKAMGFIKPHNLGPGWLKAAKPATDEVRGVLELEFEHLLPGHGDPVVGGAKQAYRPVLEGYSA